MRRIYVHARAPCACARRAAPSRARDRACWGIRYDDATESAIDAIAARGAQQSCSAGTKHAHAGTDAASPRVCRRCRFSTSNEATRIVSNEHGHVFLSS